MRRSKKTKFRLSTRQTTTLAAALVVAVIGGIVGLRLSLAETVVPVTSSQEVADVNAPVKRFVNNPARGLNWDGLRENPLGVCGNALEIVNRKGEFKGCTHGPDPAPPGVDARKPVEPMAADQLVNSSSITCEGDGKSGNRVQAMYVRPQNVASRYTQFAASFREWADIANTLYVESGYQSGSPRSIRFVTTASCQVDILEVTVPTGADADLNATIDALANLGYDRTDRKYMIWMDAAVLCGIGTLWTQNTPGPDNPNNVGPSYGRTDTGCWGGSTEAHELMHNIGSVAPAAPNKTDNFHCTDEWENMCYEDGSPQQMRNGICDESFQELFDCNKDDYFNSSASIPSSNYLSNHWNTANNQFLIKGGTPPGDTTPPYQSRLGFVDPNATNTWLPSNSVITGSAAVILVQAIDNVGIKKVEFQIDSGTIVSTTKSNPHSATYPISVRYKFTVDATKLTNGTHTFKTTAYDLKDNKTTYSQPFTIQGGLPTPPPTTPPPTTPPPTTPPPTTPPPTTPPPTTPPPTPPPKKGDLNNDGKVNISDLSILLSAWGKSGVPADLNTSGKVDIADLSILLSNWG